MLMELRRPPTSFFIFLKSPDSLTATITPARMAAAPTTRGHQRTLGCTGSGRAAR